MATIESLGSALFRRLEQARQKTFQAVLPGQGAKVAVKSLPMAKEVTEAPKEAQLSGDHSKAPRVDTGSSSQPVKRREQMSLDELAAMLHKVNLTFDLFEIQAQFSVDLKTGDIVVQVINQRTGEVIRRIPPYDVPKMISEIEKSKSKGDIDSLLTDIKG